MEALTILCAAAFTVAVAYASGNLLLARCRVVLDSHEAPAIAFITGAAVLSWVMFWIAATHVAYPAVFGALGAAAIGTALWVRPAVKRTPARLRWVWLLPFGAYSVLYLCHAMAPEASPDGSAYHLALVARYLREHGLVRITTSIYASLSQGLEMLFMFAFAFGRHSAAAMVHLAFLFALVWSMWCYARRAGFAPAGISAAMLVFASPVVGIDAASAYNDVALAAVAFALFQLLDIWERERQPGLILPIGLLAGFAYAVKYTGAMAVVYAVGFVYWRERRLAPALRVAAVAALLIVPWMTKNWLWVDNPVAPFFNQIFPNPYVTVAFEREYREYLATYRLASRWQIPMQVTTYGSLSGLLGPVILLSPLALPAVRLREGRRLLLAAAVFGSTYFANIGARFLIPVLPFVSLALMLALSRVRWLPPAVAMAHAAISWHSVVPRYAADDAWRLERIRWKEALRLRPADPYLTYRLPDYPVARMVEESTAPGSTILSFKPIPRAYTSRDVRVTYESADNQIAAALLMTASDPAQAPTWRLRFDFPKQPLEAIRVVQTAGGPRELWNIHELRIEDGDRELPRDARWRLTARPYPWTIQDAFDNSLLTFWRCGEWLRPGQYVQVDFGRSEHADRVLIETAPNQWGIRLELQGRGGNEEWRRLSPSPVAGDAPRPLGLRREAAVELKRRGIDYVLVFDDSPFAADFGARNELWGVRLAGHTRHARLYALPGSSP